ncbi:MAG: dihydroorotase [Thermodesulfovibrionia bacterium]
MKILIRNGHLIDPSQGVDGIGDVLIEDGMIKEVRVYCAGERRKEKRQDGHGQSGIRIIEANGFYVVPGLVDMHTHLREPGYEYKETIETGTKAGLHGGFTSLCAMPNTDPVNDDISVTEFILREASSVGYANVYPIGAITKGERGEELTEMEMLKGAGCVAFSDDGVPVMNSLIMRRALEYSKIINVPIISHCEDINLSQGGVMNEGFVSTSIGLRGIPNAAEEIMVARDIALCELTGGRLHIAHVSTRGSVRLIREAKKRGLKITAETCPHYFTLTDGSLMSYDTNLKVNPPLRTSEDVKAIKEGLADGTIDVIATDHAPHHHDDKNREFDTAAFGISGLETALSLSLRLVHEGVLSISQLIEKMSYIPARILGINAGTLKVGSQADLTIVDMNKEFKVESVRFLSKGKNTPFEGWILKGMPVITIYRGKVFEF